MTLNDERLVTLNNNSLICHYQEIQRSKMLKGKINAQLMTPIQRIIRYPMLLKEVCNNFDKAEQAGFPSNITFTRKQTHQRDTLFEAYNKSQILAEYTDQMLIASRITGYSVSNIIHIYILLYLLILINGLNQKNYLKKLHLG